MNEQEYAMTLVENIQGCAIDYEELSGSVGKLMKAHQELESQMNSIKTPFRRAFTRIKNAVWGAPKHSVEEVMGMQLSIIREIRKGLQFQAHKTRKKLNSIEDYTEKIEDRIKKAVEYKKEAEPLLAVMKNEIEKEYGIDDGFRMDREKKKRMKEYREALHRYELATEEAVDFRQQSKYLEVQEELIRNTTYTSERLAEKTKRIEAQISIIRGIYDSVLKQHKLYAVLYQALSSQKIYISGLDDIIVEGQKTMDDIASRSEALNSFQGNSKLEGVVESLRFNAITRYEDHKDDEDDEDD